MKAAISILLSLTLISGCAMSRTYVVGGVVQDVVAASQSQGDLNVIREGTPAYLMLIDGMIHANPGNQTLLLSGARAYATYAMIVEDSEASKKLYSKAKEYALSAFKLNKKLSSCCDRPIEEFQSCVNAGSGKADVPLLYWVAVTWGGWIGSHLDDVVAISQLPRVETLMQRAVALDETFDHGGGFLFLGAYEASRPAGQLAKAKTYFERGLEIGEGKFLMGYVYYASSYAVRARDRKAYHEALEKVINTPANVVPELTLVNTIAQDKARRMLDEEKDIFLD